MQVHVDLLGVTLHDFLLSMMTYIILIFGALNASLEDGCARHLAICDQRLDTNIILVSIVLGHGFFLDVMFTFLVHEVWKHSFANLADHLLHDQQRTQVLLNRPEIP